MSLKGVRASKVIKNIKLKCMFKIKSLYKNFLRFIAYCNTETSVKKIIINH